MRRQTRALATPFNWRAGRPRRIGDKRASLAQANQISRRRAIGSARTLLCLRRTNTQLINVAKSRRGFGSSGGGGGGASPASQRTGGARCAFRRARDFICLIDSTWRRRQFDSRRPMGIWRRRRQRRTFLAPPRSWQSSAPSYENKRLATGARRGAAQIQSDSISAARRNFEIRRRVAAVPAKLAAAPASRAPRRRIDQASCARSLGFVCGSRRRLGDSH